MALQGNDQEFFNRLSRYDLNVNPMVRGEEIQDQQRKDFYKNPFTANCPIAYSEDNVDPNSRTEVKIETVSARVS